MASPPGTFNFICVCVSVFHGSVSATTRVSHSWQREGCLAGVRLHRTLTVQENPAPLAEGRPRRQARAVPWAGVPCAGWRRTRDRGVAEKGKADLITERASYHKRRRLSDFTFDPNSPLVTCDCNAHFLGGLIIK